MPFAPILLFTYNRPLHTQKTLEALKKNPLCEKSDLFIFSDGAKNEEDAERVNEVRNVIRYTAGFKSLDITENRTNKGLAQNIIEGVTQMVEQYGKVIVLEDDLITAPYFLSFMNKALVRFEKTEKIGHIHAFCYPLPDLPDTFLIKWTGSWGWATWQRAWNRFNPNGTVLLNELEHRRLTKSFDFNGSYPYTRMLRKQVRGENNSWAIRWNASLFLNEMLSLNAGKSLVQNIGFDGSGTHCGLQDIYATSLHTRPLSLDIPILEENCAARYAFEKYYRRTNGFWIKVKRRMKRYASLTPLIAKTSQ